MQQEMLVNISSFTRIFVAISMISSGNHRMTRRANQGSPRQRVKSVDFVSCNIVLFATRRNLGLTRSLIYFRVTSSTLLYSYFRVDPYRHSNVTSEVRTTAFYRAIHKSFCKPPGPLFLPVEDERQKCCTWLFIPCQCNAKFKTMELNFGE